MIPFRWLAFLMGSLTIIFIISGCSTPSKTESTDHKPATVEIDQTLHFFMPAGEKVTVLPGAYGLNGEKFGLRLIAQEGLGDESILIEANITEQDSLTKTPLALVFSESKDEFVLTLLLPNGRRWEARGGLTGVHTRTADHPPLPNERLLFHIDEKQKAQASVPHLTLSSISLEYPDSHKTYQGDKHHTTWQLPVSDTLNSGILTLTWGGYWEKGALHPSFIPRHNEDFQNLVKKKQCCITLTLNGEKIPISRLKFGKRGTLLTRVELNDLRAQTWPKTVKVVVTKGNKSWESSDTKIYARSMSYFDSVLYPIFSHDRCTTCHALIDHDSIVEMHQYRLGVEQFPYQFEEEARPQNPTFCMDCHNSPEIKNRWVSPLATQGLNWKGWSAHLICEKVTGPFTNKDNEIETPPDPKRLYDHFHQDPRILWAVSDGTTPTGKKLTVPFPNKPLLWYSKIDPWVEADAPCPQSSRFFRKNEETDRKKFYP
ncbi:MAG: hypothetical protein MRJ96_08310 [Nitrospirales bacterium]|nr:hypothetical protein [Nitrospira sp.]MDR4501435.1 hypothetical protein [Nitrospirales bacterium]